MVVTTKTASAEALQRLASDHHDLIPTAPTSSHPSAAMAPVEEDMTEEEAMDRIVELLQGMSPGEKKRVMAGLLADEIQDSEDPEATRREIHYALTKDGVNGQSLPDGSTSAICSRCGKRAKYRACSQVSARR